MSKINKALQPFVIGGSRKPPNMSALEKLNKEFEKALQDMDSKIYLNLPKGYTYSAKPFVFPIREKHTTTVERDEGDTVRIPAYIAENEKLLGEAYDAVSINGKLMGRQHSGVIKTKDTERYILEKDAYNVLTGGYCEKKGNLVELPQYDGFAYKKDVVTTTDTNCLELKGKTYRYKNEDGETEYYKYASLAPDAPKKRVYFEEAQFPSPEELKETRLGIELEYSTAIDASREALRNPNYREKWNSVRDGSIPSEGTEFVSIPLTKEELPQVEDFIRFCQDQGARISKTCGFHVHIGSPKLDFVTLTSVVLLCQNIQEDMFKLVPDHRQNNKFCKRLDKSFNGFKNVSSNKDEKKTADKFYEDAGTSYEKRHRQSKWAVNSKRHYWVSIDRFFRFKEEKHKRTVEFRMHHATHNTEEFIQFVLLCYYLVQFAIENDLSTARTAELSDVIQWIPNRRDRERVEELLTSKKVMEYAI